MAQVGQGWVRVQGPTSHAVPVLPGSLCWTLCPLRFQAQARCHRIGQSKAVKVYRLITRNSYEREMFDKASLKLGLDKAVLQDINRKGSTNGVGWLSEGGWARVLWESSPPPPASHCQVGAEAWAGFWRGTAWSQALALLPFGLAGCPCAATGLGDTWCCVWVPWTEAHDSPLGSILK